MNLPAEMSVLFWLLIFFIDFQNVLRHGSTLSFSEFIPDPDYPLPSTLNARENKAVFRLKSRLGKLFYYTLIFDKCEEG